MKRSLGLVTALITLALLAVSITNNQNNQPSGVVSAASGTPTVTAPAADGNLLLNPSMEQSTTGWNKGSWGTNKAAFAYNNTGHTGTHSVSVTLSNYKNGDAKWYPNEVSVKPATAYTFSNWYKSTVASEIDAVITTTKGKTVYIWLSNQPASSAWKQTQVSFKTPADASKITFYHSISKNGQLTTDDYDFRVAAPTAPTTPTIPTPNPTPTPPPIVTPPPAPTAPTVSITSPAANAVVKGTQAVKSSVTDAQGIAKVQYKLDDKDLGTVTTAPYSLNWDTTKIANGNHKLTAIATNTANLSTTSAAVTINVQNPTPPTINITSPANGATVSGTHNAAVNAADAQGITSVQYKLDGQPLGSPVTVAPYGLSWNTALVANGSHSLTATVTNTANLSTTSAAVTINVQNVVVTPPTPTTPPASTNTIPNPSVETVDPATSAEPQNWNADTWGNNTSTFSYPSTGHTGNRSVRVDVSNYSTGSADWSYTAQNVSGGGHYRYTDWYKSNVTTEIDAAVTINGVVQYFYLGTVLPSDDWAQATAEFDIPAGATSVTIFHLIAGNGYLVTDDFSFGLFAPTPLNRGLVSLTFDDGWSNQYTNALPLLNKYGQKATFYVISGSLDDQPDYMSKAQIASLAAAGHELGSHSITHPDLTTLTAAQAQQEMEQSKITLQNTFGVPIANFAYPLGAYNANTINIGKTLYGSQRTVDSGYNTKDNFNLTKLMVQNVFDTTTPAQVQAWVDQANSQKAWLILVYHEIANTPIDPTDIPYTTKPSDLDAELNYIKNSGITVKTVQQAIDEILAQL